MKIIQDCDCMEGAMFNWVIETLILVKKKIKSCVNAFKICLQGNVTVILHVCIFYCL